MMGYELSVFHELGKILHFMHFPLTGSFGNSKIIWGQISTEGADCKRDWIRTSDVAPALNIHHHAFGFHVKDFGRRKARWLCRLLL